MFSSSDPLCLLCLPMPCLGACLGSLGSLFCLGAGLAWLQAKLIPQPAPDGNGNLLLINQ